MANHKIYKKGNLIFIEVDGETKKHYQNDIDIDIANGKVFISAWQATHPGSWNMLISEVQGEDGIAIGDLDNVERYLAAIKKLIGDVTLQDQHSPIIIAKLSKVEAETTMSADASIDDQTITITSATGFSAGKYLSIFDIVSNRFFVGYIISVAGSVVTLDSPLDFAFPSGSFVTAGVSDMAVDGSITPQVFGLRNTTETIGITADITRIIITVLCTNAPAYDTFGDLAKLINGIVLRKIDGTIRNIFNLKSNGELQGIMYDLSAADAVNPNQGQNGYVARLTFASQGKIGVTIRLAPGEDMRLIVQDDLSDLELFEIICEGHEVTIY